MIITVGEALQLPAMKDAFLVAGHSGLSRIISSVNIMEVPDITRFVKEEEFLITTTYPIKDDIEAQQRLIPLLVEKGVAALAIKPVFYGNKIPEDMINYANELGFPLIQLPLSTSFNEVINPILGEILNRQAIILRRNDDVHKSFTNIVLQGGTLKDIANMLASLQNTPVSIHTSRFHLLATATPDGVNGYLNIFQNLDSLSKDLRRAIGNKAGRISTEIQGYQIEVHVQPVIVAGEDYAYLLVWLGKDAGYEINVVEQAATVVALEIVKMRAVSETEHRFRSHFIEEILQRRVDSRADVLSRGEAYGWDLSLAYTPVLIEIVDYADLLAVGENNEDPLKAVRRLWTAVLKATSNNNNIIVVDIGARILLLLKTGNGIDNELLIQKLVSKIRKDVAPETNLIGVGIGRALNDIMNLKTGVEQAVKALEIGQLINGKGAITHYDELGIYRILSICKDHPELAKLSQELLGELLQNDESNKTEFIKTLDTFLRCNCNLKEAALQMFIHYNTLRYRLSKIEEIAAVDLNSSEDRLSLQIALRILRLQETQTQ